MSVERIAAAIRDIPDFPKPGILFKDITPLLGDRKLFKETVDLLQSHVAPHKPDFLVSIESRGFIFGSALAYNMGCGLVPVRKKGKLPYKTVEASYQLEYGTATLEIHQDALKKGDRVVIIDDLLATGGTAGAAAVLAEKLGAVVLGMEFVVELKDLNGRKNLPEYRVNSLVVF